MRIYRVSSVFVLVVLTLAACQPLTQIAYVEGGPTQPVVDVTSAADARPMVVQDVQIQIGLGSPMPVDIFVSGTWPGLCAQLSDIQQRINSFTIDVTIRTTPEEPNCPPDHIGLPFRIAIPINGVQLPAGKYTVTVNGVSTTFTWPYNPAAPS